MIPKLLSKEEYLATFASPMRDVFEWAEEIVDLWTYADPIIESEYHNYRAWDWRVSHILENADGTFQHIAIPVPKDNTYLIVVVELPKSNVLGHYILDLGEEYSLDSRDEAMKSAIEEHGLDSSPSPIRVARR